MSAGRTTWLQLTSDELKDVLLLVGVEVTPAFEVLSTLLLFLL